MLRKAGLACTICGSRNYTLNLSSVAKEKRVEVKKLAVCTTNECIGKKHFSSTLSLCDGEILLCDHHNVYCP